MRKLFVAVGALSFASLAPWFSLFTNFSFANQFSTIRLKNPNSKLILTTPLTNFNGTLALKDHTDNTILGGTVSFVEGVLQSGNLSTMMTGNLDTATDKILLQGNATLDILTGNIGLPIDVSNSNNLIAGRLFINDPISLQNASSEVTIGIQTPLGGNIILNNGTMHLLSDLQLGEGSLIVGPGTIDSNGLRLAMGTTSTLWNQDLTFTNDASLELNSSIILQNCTWNFSDVAGFTTINGNGHTIDVGANATINLAAKHILVLNNVTLKGLGDGLTDGKIIFGDNDTTVVMTGVTIDQANNFTLSQGQFYMQASNCTTVIKNFLFNITGSAILTIDGIALIWDKLASTDNSNPIIPSGAGNLVFLNGGYIKSINTTSQPTFVFSTSSSLTSNIPVSTSGNVIIQNANPLTPKSITISGNGNTISFSGSTSSQSFLVEDNVALTLADVVLKDFNPDSISLGTDSSIELGDDTVIELSRDTYFSKKMRVTGNITIVGNGCNLFLTNPDALIVDAPSKNLTIQHVNLHNISSGSSVPPTLRINYDDSTVTMKDTTIILDNDYNISSGGINFAGNVKFAGNSKIFTYTSKSQSNILTNSMLTFDIGTTFSYAADIGVLPANADSTSYQNSRNRIGMIDRSSILCLEGATLHSTHTGILLNTGTLLIKDNSTLRSVAGIDEGPYNHATPSSGEEATLGSSLLVKILSGAILNVSGKVVYD